MIKTFLGEKYKFEIITKKTVILNCYHDKHKMLSGIKLFLKLLQEEHLEFQEKLEIIKITLIMPFFVLNIFLHLMMLMTCFLYIKELQNEKKRRFSDNNVNIEFGDYRIILRAFETTSVISSVLSTLETLVAYLLVSLTLLGNQSVHTFLGEKL